MENTYEFNDDIQTLLKKHSDMVRKICFLYLKSSNDEDDVFQEVFLKMLLNESPFMSEEHEKAWLIRVTINKCKDILKSFWRRNMVSIENVELPFEDKAENELLQVVLQLPEKYKEVIYLYYYEGYTVPEMTMILGRNENTIYSSLHRAKNLMKKKLEEKEHDYTF